MKVKAQERTKTREFEVQPRVHEIEQQLQEHLPTEWREFAGKPIRMTYYDTNINTFRANPKLKPSDAYVRWAMKELRSKLEDQDMSLFSDDELREIIHQEWRTDMTRSVWEGRLNRHGSKDGPVVRRSRCGVVFVADQPQPGEQFVVDGMTHVSKKKSK